MTARLGADRLIGFWLNSATQSATGGDGGRSGLNCSSQVQFGLRATFSPCLLWIVVIHLLWAWGDAFFRAFVPAARPATASLYKGDRGHAHHHQSLGPGSAASAVSISEREICIEALVCVFS